MTIVEFLEARLSEDEDVAKASIAQGSSGSWEARGKPGQPGDLHDAQFHGPVAWNHEESAFDNYEDAAHAARHDPARALREVAAKRAIIRSIEELVQHAYGYDSAGTVEKVLTPLAAIYSDHPDYRKEWAIT